MLPRSNLAAPWPLPCPVPSPKEQVGHSGGSLPRSSATPASSPLPSRVLRAHTSVRERVAQVHLLPGPALFSPPCPGRPLCAHPRGGGTGQGKLWRSWAAQTQTCARPRGSAAAPQIPSTAAQHLAWVLVWLAGLGSHRFLRTSTFF